MIQNLSPFLLIKQLQLDVFRALSPIDSASLATPEQQTLLKLKNCLVDARLDVQDYELAETRDDQLRNAKEAKERLDFVHDAITRNTLQVFGAVDVAHLSAQISQIKERLR